MSDENAPMQFLLRERSYADLTIIIPTLNEAQTIGDLLKRIIQLYPGVCIIVSDDGSADGTQRIVQAISEQMDFLGRSRVLLNERVKAKERGITASVVDALAVCETKFFVVMNGDFQHPPQFIHPFFETVRTGAPLVVGTRLPYRGDLTLKRFLLSRTATVLAKLHCTLRGLKIRDPLSGFFGGETQLVNAIIRQAQNRLEPKGYKILFDLLRVMDKKTTIQQVDYAFGPRFKGSSKFGAKHGLYFLRSFFH